MNSDDINKIEQSIGYKFHNKDLIITAFTHSSYANEHDVTDYERLEFLGDSLLGAITTIYLYNNSAKSEGDLSKFKAKLVCAKSLRNVIAEMGLDKYILVGRSINHNAIPDNIIADVFESIVGSIYLDGGVKSAWDFVHSKLLISPENVRKIYSELLDYKTMLQEKLQAKGLSAVYLSEDIGTDQMPRFHIRLMVGGKVLTEAEAESKKKAEQYCAKTILENSGGLF